MTDLANGDVTTEIGGTDRRDEIGGMARQMELAVRRAAGAVEELRELPAGGTAVGSGINTHKKFGAGVAAALAEETKIPFVEAENHLRRMPSGTVWLPPMR